MKNPLISIITVVYNGEAYIESTLQSIKSQTSKNFEYLIIDGASSDNTLQIINENKEFVDLLLSEPDKGIYDAMNKGLKHAKGDYVWFINAGDRIFAPDTIEEIEKLHASFPQADVFYGKTLWIDQQGNGIGMHKKATPENLTSRSLLKGLVVSHQSILIKRSTAPFYDLSYTVTADYQWVLSSLEKANEIINTHLILSKFLENGFSTQNKKKALKERWTIMSKHFGFFTTFWAHVRITFKYFEDKIRKTPNL